MEDIRIGNTGYLNDFLNAVIAEEVEEDIADIFGQGVELDDSEVVQTARRAIELLDTFSLYVIYCYRKMDLFENISYVCG